MPSVWHVFVWIGEIWLPWTCEQFNLSFKPLMEGMTPIWLHENMGIPFVGLVWWTTSQNGFEDYVRFPSWMKFPTFVEVIDTNPTIIVCPSLLLITKVLWIVSSIKPYNQTIKPSIVIHWTHGTAIVKLLLVFRSSTSICRLTLTIAVKRHMSCPIIFIY